MYLEFLMSDSPSVMMFGLSSHHGFRVATHVLNQFLKEIHHGQSLGIEVRVSRKSIDSHGGKLLEFPLVFRVGSEIPKRIE